MRIRHKYNRVRRKYGAVYGTVLHSEWADIGMFSNYLINEIFIYFSRLIV